MQFILLRHGNTFESGQTPFWIGSGQDMPLTQHGRRQAHQAAETIARRNHTPARILCSPLIRTHETATIIQQKCGGDVETLPALVELDYGAWAGLTDVEIERRFGCEPLRSWRQEGKWPGQASGWGEEREVIARVESLARQIVAQSASSESVVIVSSQGILRYFLRLDLPAYVIRAEVGTLGIRPGHLGEIVHNTGQYEVKAWDVDPSR